MLVILLFVVSVTIQTAHNFRKNSNTFAKNENYLIYLCLQTIFKERSGAALKSAGV